MTVRLAVVDGVATITLDRPDQLNRWTATMAHDLSDALRSADSDGSVGAIVLTGAGRAFCAGLDLSESPSFDADDRPEPATLPWQLSKPVIAALNGHAIGVGATLALTADVRYVAAEAKVQFPFVRLGLVSELGSHALLPRIVGLEAAADLLLSGRVISGAEAAELRLASRCLPSSDVLTAATDWARDVATSTSREAVAMSKRLLWRDVERLIADVAPLEVDQLARLARSPSAKAAMQARSALPLAAIPFSSLAGA